jgi:hypothetical protein
MIAGYLKLWDKEKHLYAPTIQKALAWLQSADLANLPTGRQVIDGDNMYALVNEYTTEPKQNDGPKPIANTSTSSTSPPARKRSASRRYRTVMKWWRTSWRKKT